MFEGEIVGILEKKKQKDLDIKTLSPEDFERMGEQWSRLAKRFLEYARTNAPDLRVIVAEDVKAGAIFENGVIKINEKILTSTEERDFESNILQFWAQYLDNKLPNTMGLNRLTRAIVPNFFEYFMLSGGDLEAAERYARNFYKEHWAIFLSRYSKPDMARAKGGESDFNLSFTSKVNWSEASTRALELYKHPETRKFCAALGLVV